MSVPPALAGGFVSTCFSSASIRMKPERWQKVEELYHAALEQPAELRTDFLRSARGDDEELYREVESLLDFKSQAENFIERPALEIAAKAVAADSGTSVI